MNETAARKQAKREAAFYRNLAAFVLVNAFLVAINLLTSPGHFWAIYPILGWGLGIASQAFATFGDRGSGGWMERRTQELMGAEASETRLRELLDETLDERTIPAGAPQDVARLQRRIEHLEAIVTSRDWDEIRAGMPAPLAQRPPLADALDDLSGPDGTSGSEEIETPEARAARLARRVR